MELSDLKSEVKQIALNAGAKLVGIGSRERLNDAPPSADMEYSLKGAQSCVIWAYPIPFEILKSFISKKERWSYREHLDWSYKQGWKTGIEIAKFIETNSEYKAAPIIPNAGYRSVNLRQKMILRLGRFVLWLRLGKKIITRVMANTFGEKPRPEFSLRYGAVAAGLGRLGWSGNLITEDYGSAVHLGGVLTNAPLEPDPLVEENPCNKCKTCYQACPTGLFSKNEAEEPVIIAGREEIYAKRNSYARCFLGCGGWASLGAEKTWSTWSPDHEISIKEVSEEEIMDPKWRKNYIYKNFFSKETPKMQRKWNRTILNEFIKAGILNNVGHPKRRLKDNHPTCGVCQAVCVEDMEQRKELLHLLRSNGKMYVDEDFKEYIKRTDESGNEVIYYPLSEQEYEESKK